MLIFFKKRSIVINMTPCEATAILNYLEYHLLTLVESVEKNIVDPEIVGDLYERSYQIVKDFERTLTTQVMLDEKKGALK